MQRRSFLSLATGAVSAAVCRQSSATPSPAQATPTSSLAHPVLAHQDRSGETRNIGYSTLSYKVLTQDTHGDLFAAEHALHQRGGPPRHMHFHQDEWFYVIEGEFIAEIGDKRLTLRPGDSVLGPRNIPHAWACVGEGNGKLLLTFTPAGKIEAFFNEVTKTKAAPPQDKTLFAAYDMVLIGPPLAV